MGSRPAALGLLVGLVALTAPSVAAAGWTEHQPVAHLGDDEIAGFPQATIGDDGEGVAAWVQVKMRGSRTFPSTQRVFVATARAGRTFHAPVQVTPRGAFLIDLRTAPDGSVGVLYQSNENDDDECGRDCPQPVRLVVRDADGDWGRAERVGPDGIHPAMGIGPDGSFEIVYVDSESTRVTIRRRLGRGRWTAPRALSEPGASSVAYANGAGGAAIVAWLLRMDHVAGTAEVRRRAPDDSFGPVSVVGTPGRMVAPVVAIGERGHSAVATQYADAPPSVQVEYGDADGKLVGADRMADVGSPNVAVDRSGTTLLKYVVPACLHGCPGSFPGQPLPPAQTFVAARRVNGEWSEPQKVADSGWTGFDVKFDARGRGYVLLSGFGGPPTVLERPPDGAFGEGRVLAPEAGQSGELAVNRRGQAIAAFVQGAPGRVEAATRLP